MVETYADPEEHVTVTGIGPKTLRRAVRKHVSWRENHGLGLVFVHREGSKERAMFDMADLSRLAEIERFKSRHRPASGATEHRVWPAREPVPIARHRGPG